MTSYSKLITNCEAYLRQGRIELAAKEFRNISLSKLLTSEQVAIAKLGRRVGQTTKALRILQNKLSSINTIEKQTDDFNAEYAVLLTLNGCVDEAMHTLENASVKNPNVLIAKAWAYFEKWEYSKAIPILKKYILLQKEDYQKIAGYINLAEAYIGAGFPDNSLLILSKSIYECQKNNYLRLLANSLHIRAMAYQHLGQLKKSNTDIYKALNVFGNTKTSDSFLIYRQLYINKTIQYKNPEFLDKFKLMALENAEYESLRYADYWLLKIKFNQNRFLKLYYGTSYLDFQKKLKMNFPQGQLKSYYIYGNKNFPCLDLTTEPLKFNNKNLNLTKQIHRLLLILIQDQYNPARLGNIFSAVIPDSFYMVNDSNILIHQAIKRLRHWLKQNKIPLRIQCKYKRYQLIPHGPISILINANSYNLLSRSSPFQLLKANFAKSDFTLKQVQQVLKVSKATAHRIITNEILSKTIQKSGTGKNTKYLFL